MSQVSDVLYCLRCNTGQWVDKLSLAESFDIPYDRVSAIVSRARKQLEPGWQIETRKGCEYGGFRGDVPHWEVEYRLTNKWRTDHE